jgi:hypothetical protein
MAVMLLAVAGVAAAATFTVKTRLHPQVVHAALDRASPPAPPPSSSVTDPSPPVVSKPAHVAAVPTMPAPQPPIRLAQARPKKKAPDASAPELRASSPASPVEANAVAGDDPLRRK